MRLFPFVESVMSALCTGAPWILQQLGEKRDHCEGDCRLLDQLGEKQDFEAELSRLGLGHEAFTLHVLRQTSEDRRAEWGQNYSVTATNVVTERSHLYQGGPSLITISAPTLIRRVPKPVR